MTIDEGKDECDAKGGAPAAAAAVEPQDKPMPNVVLEEEEVPAPAPPPNLTNIPPVIWEQILSFLTSQNMCMAATQLCKTISQDRGECLENASKLALKCMVEEASCIHHAYLEDNRGKVPHNDDMFGPDAAMPTCIHRSMAEWTPPALDGEKYHRTYHLACEMLHAGACHIYENWEDGREDNNGFYHLYIVAYLIYGSPPLPPLDKRQMSILDHIASCFTNAVALLRPCKNGLPDIGKEVRAVTKARLDFYCRGRILRIAKRLYQIGEMSGSMLLLDLLTYNYSNAGATVYEAQYFLGCRVVLQGLSRADLNGRAGEVEKLYSRTNQRIGIRLDVVEGESTAQLVGIKPRNLRAEKEDSDLVMDQKIMAGMFSSEYTTMEITTYPAHMSRDISVLRTLRTTLTARIEASGKKACAKYISDGQHALYRCDVLRLLNVQIALSRLLFFRARQVGCQEIRHDQGDLQCAATEIVAAAIANGESDTVLAGIATESLLREGAEALSAAQDLESQFDRIDDEKKQVGLLGEALPPGLPLYTRISPIKDYCFAFMHACVSHLIFRLEISFLQIEEDDDDNLILHARRSVQFYREWCENFLSAIKRKCHPRALTIEEICCGNSGASLHTFVIRDFVRMLIGLAMQYLTCAAADVPLREHDECEELFYFLGLGVALAIRSLGSGSVFADRWCILLRRLTDQEECPVEWRCNPLEDPKHLENILDAWFADGGGFRCLYV